MAKEQESPAEGCETITQPKAPRRFTGKCGKKLRGVNLGGWLVLEKWITPSLFKGLKATDETSYCAELGPRAEHALKSHWNSFITKADFAWLAEKGINAVRIPVGHWIFGAYPYHWAYAAHPDLPKGMVQCPNLHPYVRGGEEVLDRAFDWAEEYGLHVVLDVHTGPGCQNGYDNGGIRTVCEWHTKEEYINHSLDVVERLAERYHQRPCLHAIELLNEPHRVRDTNLLKRFIADGYRRIRKFCTPNDVAVVFCDNLCSFRDYMGFMLPPEFENVVFDTHRYQCFGPERNLDIYGHIQKAALEWKNEADENLRDFGLGTYIGEWSLGLDEEVVNLWAAGPFKHALQGLDEFQKNVAKRAYGAAQLATFEKYLGWFFWTYRTETTPAWCFRECVERGWLPDNFRE